MANESSGNYGKWATGITAFFATFVPVGAGYLLYGLAPEGAHGVVSFGGLIAVGLALGYEIVRPHDKVSRRH